MKSMRVIALAGLLGMAGAHADEGMWTFDNPPLQQIKARHGVDIDADWLARVSRSITRLEGGCTGSFVSPEGLVLTNHHCVMDCLANLSNETDSLVEQGFNARQRSEERQCPSGMLSVLIDSENVTAKVNAATAGLNDAQANSARRETLARLESQCTAAAEKQAGGPLACEAVTLYQGGQYFIYKYRRYDDVRLAFAPEYAIGAFGGDPDNFNFPRWSLDFALLRAYENGKPAHTPTHLQWRNEGPQQGEATFVAGHPGRTSRLLTLEQLRFQRDVVVPSYLNRNNELRGRLIQWGKTSEQAQRIVREPLQGYENGLKVYRGFQQALLDDAAFQRRAAEERELQQKIATDSELTAQVGSAWDDITRAQQRYRQIYDTHVYLESGAGFNSRLFGFARALVRGTAERDQPNERRLREYTDSNLPKLQADLLASTPVYPDYEQLTLSFSFDKMREVLGPDHPVVRQLLSQESPDSLAAKLINGTQLADPAARKALWEGGAKAVAASTDPMIVLARDVDAQAREVRRIYEDEVQAPVAASQERIAAARFAVLGTDTYPDATFTLRLSYGAVEGWEEKGEQLAPFSRLGRMYERATGKEPFALPQDWLRARERLDPQTPFCYVTTNDIVGGNSGSPLVDAQGRVVGLAFDGNIHSLSGNFWYDAELNRSVAVHPAIITTALEQVYGAKELARELQGQR